MPAKKASKKAASRRSSASVHPLQKSYFLDEQEQFFRDHPLAQMLLSVFILAVIIFFVVVYVTRYMR